MCDNMKNDTKTNILDILRADGGYVSGEAISARLGITRSAVWKSIAALKKDGFAITAVTNKGYKLDGESARLNEDSARALLDTEFLGRPLYLFDTVSSTFDKIAEYPRTHGLTVAAKVQTNGRGRLGRDWKSDSGGVYFSFNLMPMIPPSEVTFITVICALGTVKALSQYGDCRIKWPNDIVLNGKKICGILTTMSICEGETEYVCVGIGINADKTDFEGLPNATSIKNETGRACDENKLLTDVLKSIEKEYMRGRDAVLDEYKKYCITLGSTVAVHYADGRESFVGKCTGITDDGALTVTDGTSTVTVSSGEVSVRGLYGYVD